MAMLGGFNLETLLDAIKGQESGGDPNAVSPAGARTAYGIMPDTARDPGYGLPKSSIQAMLADPAAARNAASNYLTAMFQRTGNIPGALASYNGGLKRGIAYNKGGRVPAETAGYVPSVLDRYKKLSAASPSLLAGDQGDQTDQPSAPTPGVVPPGTIMDAGAPPPDATAAPPSADTSQSDVVAPGSSLLGGDGALPMSPLDTPRAQFLAKIAEAKAANDAKNGPAAGAPNTTTLTKSTPAGGIANPFASSLETGNNLGVKAPPVGKPLYIAPPTNGDGSGVENTDAPAAGAAAAPATSWGDRLTSMGPALLALGAGIAGGADKGWGAGLGAGFAGASDVMQKERDRNLENAPKMAVLKAIYDEEVAGGAKPKDAYNTAVREIYAPGSMETWKPFKTGTDSNGNDQYKLFNDKGEVKEIPGAGASTKEDAVDANGAPLVGQDYIDYMKKNHPDDARTQLSLSNYDSDPKNLSLRKNQREHQLNGAMRMNPDFEPTNYNNIYTTRKNFLGGGQASVALGSGDQLVHHIGTMLNKFDAMNQIGGGPMHSSSLNPLVAPYNAAREKWLGATGSAELTGAGSPVEGVSNEMAKLTHGVGAVPEQQVGDWKKGINTHLTPEQQTESAKSLLTLAGGAFKRYKDVWERSVGPAYAAQHPFSSIFKLDNESRAVLSRVGLSPDDFGLESEPAATDAVAPAAAGADVPPAGLNAEDQKLWPHYSAADRAAILKGMPNGG